MAALAPAARTVTRRDWYGLAVLVAGVALLLINGTVVAVLMPVVITDLGMTLTQAQWANAIFTLTFAALLLPAGWLGARYGARRILVIGVLLFTVGTLLVGSAGSAEIFIAARAVQGIAAALINPTALSVLNDTFRGPARIKAFAVWGAALGGAAALGPLIGGWLSDAWSWRAAFLINVPLAIGVLIGCATLLSETASARTRRRFDLTGAVLASSGLVVLVFTLIEGHEYGWIQPAKDLQILGFTWSQDAPLSIVPFLLVLGAGLMAAFARHETRLAESGGAPLADLRLFRIPTFRRGNITLLLATLGQFGLIFTLPLFCSVVLGYTTSETGWAMASLALGAMVSAIIAAPLAKRMSLRRLINSGMFAAAAMMAALGLLLSPGISFGALAAGLFLYGAGVGIATAQLSGVILQDVDLPQSGQASAIQATARQLGSAMGTAVLGTILAVTLSSQVSAALSDVPGLPEQVVSPLSDAIAESGGTAIVTIRDADAANAFAGLPGEAQVDPVVAASVEGYTDATRLTLLAGSLIILAGAVISLRLHESGPKS